MIMRDALRIATWKCGCAALRLANKPLLRKRFIFSLGFGRGEQRTYTPANWMVGVISHERRLYGEPYRLQNLSIKAPPLPIAHRFVRPQPSPVHGCREARLVQGAGSATSAGRRLFAAKKILRCIGPIADKPASRFCESRQLAR